jgi:serine/threonine protein kinase
VSDYLRDRLVAAVGDHYLIEAELGRGGMAAVYRARDVRLNRLVAIKVLPPELAFNPSVRSRFLREAQMAAQLTHPNIVPIFAVDEREGLVYFVMAFVDGESVGERIGRDGRMPVERVRDVLGQVADALDYAHKQGVIHRDIKPDNILIDRGSSRPLVTDFGIARAAAEESRLTVTGMAVGTPAYMSPEQAMGDRDIDGRSDIYSLGIVAYQMLVGETPFKASNTPAMLMKHVSEPPPPLRGRRADVPAELASAIERALAKKPEARWSSGAELRDAVLDRAQSRPYSESAHAAPSSRQPSLPSLPPQPPAWYPRRPVSTGAHREDQRLLPPVFNAPPPGLTRAELKDWERERRQALRDAYRRSNSNEPRTIEEKIARLRRRVAGYVGTVALLGVINAITSPWFPWFLFPMFGMLVPILIDLGGLWGDGVPLRRIFFGPNKTAPPQVSAAPRPIGDPASAVAAPEILQGPHGPAIRRAASSRQVITDLLSRMTPKERQMLPADIDTTVNALVDRVASIGTTLHRLDADANGSTLGSLDERIGALKRDPESSERERRLALLERQRSTLRDLLERRNALLAQIESAGLALENLKLDLVRFRSAGVSTALEDVTSATKEARAVSRDIGHMLDAADEVRRM